MYLYSFNFDQINTLQEDVLFLLLNFAYHPPPQMHCIPQFRKQGQKVYRINKQNQSQQGLEDPPGLQTMIFYIKCTIIKIHKDN